MTEVLPRFLSSTTLDKYGSVPFRSPEGFLGDVYLTVPSFRFNPSGTYSVGLHLTGPELFGIEAELRRLFATAFPDETDAPHIPFREGRDGVRMLWCKSSDRPDIFDASHRRLIRAEAGSRARLSGTAKPWRRDGRCGVALFPKAVEIITPEPRSPRRERAVQEHDALRQAVARAVSRTR